MGIKRGVVQALIERGHLLAALLLRKPAQEGAVSKRRDHFHAVGSIDIVGVDAGLQAAAVGIELDIAVVLRAAGAVNAVKEQVCLCQTPPHQTGQHTAAGAAVRCKPEDDLRLSSVGIGHHAHEIIVLVDPAAAEIICKADQCIKLRLGKGAAILFSKILDCILIADDALTQESIRLFFGNAVCLILIQLIAGAGSTVAHSPLVDIPIRLHAEALDLADHIKARFTHDHTAVRAGGQGLGGVCRSLTRCSGQCHRQQNRYGQHQA